MMHGVVALFVMLFACPAMAMEARRFAVVVGANEAPVGRMPLRYAHGDAQSVAQVLTDVGHFAAEDVHLMLDPEPADVLRTLDQLRTDIAAAGDETLLLFYYSGHADGQVLYPQGKPLTLQDLRRRLDGDAARVRLGVIDACRGGGWTGTKGLHAADVFDVELPVLLANEGTALIASSSGLEDAHEWAQMEGSFFTHHWVAALRGAGDRNGDGEVSLNESFDYAKALTIRDTTLHAPVTQHPSFDVHLRGRRDLPLTRVATSDTVLAVQQDMGPLQVVQMESGVVLVEVPTGKRSIKLAVPPGDYMVQRKGNKNTVAQEVTVLAGSTTEIAEAQLQLVGSERLAVKRGEPLAVTLSTPPSHTWDLAFALGVDHANGSTPQMGVTDRSVTGTFGLFYAITDRLEWAAPLPVFAYRLGDMAALEWIVWGGLAGLGVAYSSSTEGYVASIFNAGLDMRWWNTAHSSVNGRFVLRTDYLQHFDGAGATTTSAEASVGYSHTLNDAVTINISLTLRDHILDDWQYDGTFGSQGAKDLVLTVGSAMNRGLRPLPLLQVHLTDTFSLDAYAAVSYGVGNNVINDTYMAGFSWQF